MSWFFVDDGFHDHPKLDLVAPDMRMQAAGLWVTAGSWSRMKMTGGDVPRNRIALLGGTIEQADSLVTCGLWVKTEHGYRFHEWSEWQETPEEVQRRKEDGRKRTQKWREKKAKKAKKKRDASPTHHATSHQRVGDRKVLGEGEEEGEGTWGGGSSKRETPSPASKRADELMVQLKCIAGGGR